MITKTRIIINEKVLYRQMKIGPITKPIAKAKETHQTEIIFTPIRNELMIARVRPVLITKPDGTPKPDGMLKAVKESSMSVKRMIATSATTPDQKPITKLRGSIRIGKA